MEYLLFLNLFMVSRLGYLLKDGPLGMPLGWSICAVQLVFLITVFQFSSQLLILAVFLPAATALNRLAEKRSLSLPGIRATSFLAIALIASFLFQQAIEIAPWCKHTFIHLAALSTWTANIDAAQWVTINTVIFGALLLTNEVNLLIRYGFYKLHLEPKTPQENQQPQGETDRNEYNAGRVIGILERYLMYTVLLTANSYNAIGFIVAAKGIARFKQMEQRHFAEYVLVGTLASTMAAIVVAGIINWLL